MNRRDLLKASLPLVAGAWRLPHWACAQAAAGSLSLPAAGADGWISLLNSPTSSGWYSMLGKLGKSRAIQEDRKDGAGLLTIVGNESHRPANGNRLSRHPRKSLKTSTSAWNTSGA